MATKQLNSSCCALEQMQNLTASHLHQTPVMKHIDEVSVWCLSRFSWCSCVNCPTDLLGQHWNCTSGNTGNCINLLGLVYTCLGIKVPICQVYFEPEKEEKVSSHLDKQVWIPLWTCEVEMSDRRGIKISGKKSILLSECLLGACPSSRVKTKACCNNTDKTKQKDNPKQSKS